MANKRYFWLKLQDDFFTSKRIKKLRRLAGGDTYVIIYLKMQLLSLKTGGVLEYSGLEDTFADELALDLDEDVENVQITIGYLERCGLLEVSGTEYTLPYVDACTGSETASTQRSRDYRKRQKALQCNTNATEVQRDCNVEKEIDKDIDIEKESEKKKKENTSYFSDEVLDQTFKDYIAMRKAIKKPMTDKAIKIALNKLQDLSNGDTDTAVKILEQSIMNSWQGLFELKNSGTKSGGVNWDAL